MLSACSVDEKPIRCLIKIKKATALLFAQKLAARDYRTAYRQEKTRH